MGSGDPPGLQNRRLSGSTWQGCVRLAHASANFCYKVVYKKEERRRLRLSQDLEHRAGVEPAMRALQARALAAWRPVRNQQLAINN